MGYPKLFRIDFLHFRCPARLPQFSALLALAVFEFDPRLATQAISWSTRHTRNVVTSVGGLVGGEIREGIQGPFLVSNPKEWMNSALFWLVGT